MFEKISKKEFLDLQNRVGSLEVEIEKLRTHINSLRGLFNRKFAPGQEKETIKNTPSVDGLDELRKT